MDEGWLEESHYKMSKKIAQLTRVRVSEGPRARAPACCVRANLSPTVYVHTACTVAHAAPLRRATVPGAREGANM